MMSRHGISGCSSLNGLLTRRAASPISSSERSILLRFPRLERYSSRVTPFDSSMTSRVNGSMSRTYASSRDIERPLVFEDLPSPDVIRAALDHALFDKVHIASDDRLELVLHFDQLK